MALALAIKETGIGHQSLSFPIETAALRPTAMELSVNVSYFSRTDISINIYKHISDTDFDWLSGLRSQAERRHR